MKRVVFPLQAALLSMKLRLQKDLNMEQVSSFYKKTFGSVPSIPVFPAYGRCRLCALSDVCSSDPDGQAAPG